MLTYLGLATSLAAVDLAAVTQRGVPSPTTSTRDIEPRAGTDEILIIGIRLRGDAVGNTAPVRRIGEQELGSYGASNVKDLVERLEPETRGNGSGASAPQIVLLNGSRIASFSDIGGLPVEAVERVDVLPEETALSYGYPVGARVLNVVLRDRFRAVTADSGVGLATRGGRESLSTEWNFAKVRGPTRFTVDLSLAHDGALDESERDIFADSLGVLVNDQASTELRSTQTLLPSGSRAALGVALARPLLSRTTVTISGHLSTSRNRSSFGRPLLATSNPFSDYGEFITFSADRFRRELENTTFRLSGLISGDVGLWRWSAAVAGERSRSITRDTASVVYGSAEAFARHGSDEFPALSIQEDSGDLRETSFNTQRGAIDLSASGPLASLRTGQVHLTVAAAAEFLGFSPGRNFSVAQTRDLRRTHSSLAASLDVPLARADSDLGGVVGNLNATVRHIPRFGWLRTIGAGLRWTPIRPLSLNFTYTDDDGFPSLRELGEPVLSVPNVLVFDPTRGETASVTRLEGGNPLLRSNNRRERKIEAIFRPPGIPALIASANYSEVDLRNPIATFPIVSPALETAFPDRFQRDSTGRLIGVDARSISVSASHFRGVRWGLQYAPQPRRDDRSPTRIGVGLFHTLRFRNDIRTSETGPVLDLLDGAAIGPRGGVPRHLIEGNARIFAGPVGVFTSASWQSDTTVRAGAGDLFYSDGLRVNASFFLNFAQWAKASRLPSWLRAGRLTLSIDNALDTRLRVRDAEGRTPFAYQPDYLDPLGRNVRLSFRTTIF